MKIESVLQKQDFTIYIEQNTYVGNIEQFKDVIQEFLNYTGEAEYEFSFELENGNDIWVRMYNYGYEQKKTIKVDLCNDLPAKEHLLKDETTEEVLKIINKELSFL